MKFNHFLLLVVVSFFLGSCQPNEKQVKLVNQEVQNPLQDSSAVQFLLFCKEGKMEIWTDSKAEKPRLLEHLQVDAPIDFPIGTYSLQKLDKDWQLQYPNAFYQDKLGKKAPKQTLSFQKWQKNHPTLQQWLSDKQAQKVLVFPNDIRATQKWEACFACPHWMAELYGMLRMEIRQFSES